MPYKVSGNKVLHYKGGRWKTKQTCSSPANAKKAISLLQGIEHGTLAPRKKRKWNLYQSTENLLSQQQTYTINQLINQSINTPLSKNKFEIIEPTKVLKKYIKQSKNKTNIIIVLSYLGLEGSKKLAQEVSGIDIIILLGL